MTVMPFLRTETTSSRWLTSRWDSSPWDGDPAASAGAACAADGRPADGPAPLVPAARVVGPVVLRPPGPAGRPSGPQPAIRNATQHAHAVKAVFIGVRLVGGRRVSESKSGTAPGEP